MAQKLYDFFLKAGDLGGVQARTRLSILAKMTSTEAKSLADTDEKIQFLEVHYQAVVKEFGKSGATKAFTNTVSDSSGRITEKLRKQMAVFSDLTAQRSVYGDSIDSTSKRITESLVEAIDVERASIWLYNNDQTAIECVDLYVRSSREHTAGAVLKSSDFPNYFNAVGSQRTIAAENAHSNPATAEFSEVYLRPLGINAMLDVPIWANGKMVGVVCHEHTGDFRKWTTDEETFAYIMGNIVGMTMERLGITSV
ncbi:GAF domain-containing protein [Cytophagales bacterium LB-30]|uniref:GAF domain-containing protein n=1 Tax=Shiella aurantiaca TaxID=3058365 RepID=A0ABT8F0L8_9BACT|nr:GAF domain-containing protein [Shiella aurantiaca]MDN4163955.1 GAF domain-containing protein [Shiella aurantiaca]